MEEFESNLKVINRLCWFFISAGLIEIFLLIFILHNFFGIIPGLITIFPAYSALNKIDKKMNYFVGIWPLIKYNPITLSLVSFILTDFSGGRYSVNLNLLSIFVMLFFILGVLSIVFGIILIIKIAKHNRIIRLQIK